MMLLCREFGTAISESAKVCPRCGVQNPFEPRWLTLMSGISSGLLGVSCLGCMLPISAVVLVFCYIVLSALLGC